MNQPLVHVFGVLQVPVRRSLGACLEAYLNHSLSDMLNFFFSSASRRCTFQEAAPGGFQGEGRMRA